MRPFPVLLFFLLLMHTPVLAAPVLDVPGPTFDFGTVYQGEQVPHVFTFTNSGDSTLLIEQIRSSCGCTAALVSEKILPPGSGGEIQVSFDSTRFRGDVTKTVYVYSNDPVRPVLQLFVKGQVREAVVVEPAQVYFGSVTAGRTAQSEVLLRNQGKTALTFGVPVTTAEELSVRIPGATLAPGEEMTLTLTLAPKPGPARFSGYVLLQVSGGTSRELRIPVYAAMSE